ncbi:MAG: polyphosphate kinase 2 family protein [Acidimicrobiales bacterium]
MSPQAQRNHDAAPPEPAIDVSRLRVTPGRTVDLARIATRATDGFDGDKTAGRTRLEQLTARLGQLQHLLAAAADRALLVVLQAPDAGGKDGTIRAIFTGVNPQGTRVTSFKAPTQTELAHDYLWRVHAHMPAKGEIMVFNRSHYEDVLVVKVHGLVPPDRIERRYGHINDFERLLVDEGTTVVKVFLHISKEEQGIRLQQRLDDPTKRWKFRRGDLDERAHWPAYQQAFEVMLERTSTAIAPWYVVPADRNWFRDLAVAQILVDALETMDLQYPPPEEGLAGLKVI